jgi:O-antigen ligase
LITAAALLVVCIIFGGGGSPSPNSELIVEIAALAALSIWAFLPPRPLLVDRVLWIVVILWIAIPLVQLVPLPPAVWHHLPGRQLEVEALALVSADQSWRPISMAPYRTLASLLSLIPPVVVIFFVSQLDLLERSRLLVSVIVVILIAAVLGLLQVSGGNNGVLVFYPNISPGFATGFQANRNAAADVLLIGGAGLAATALAIPHVFRTMVAKALLIAVAAFLVLSVVLTGSRAGTVLIVVPAVIAGVAYWVRRHGKRRLLIALAIAAAAVLILTVITLQNPRVARTMARFSDDPSMRLGFWKDTIFAAKLYWPFGSGIGTFEPIFRINERLEAVRDVFVNRAHQDYLEFFLEAGVFAIIAVAAAIGAIAVRTATRLRQDVNRPHFAQTVFAISALAVLGLHSLVDYPMRSIALASLGGLACGVLSHARSRLGDFRESE